MLRAEHGDDIDIRLQRQVDKVAIVAIHGRGRRQDADAMTTPRGETFALHNIETCFNG